MCVNTDHDHDNDDDDEWMNGLRFQLSNDNHRSLE